MTAVHTRRGRTLLTAIPLAATLALTGCGDDSDASPEIKVAIGNASATIEPTLYCVDGAARLADEDTKTAAIEAAPDTPISISVPQDVADAGWAIQIWSVNDTESGAVPLEQIGDIGVGTERSYDGFTTSDAVPNRYFVIVAIPEDPDCNAKGAAGIWTLLVSRVE